MSKEDIIQCIGHLSVEQLEAVLRFLDRLLDHPENQIDVKAPDPKDIEHGK